MSRAYRLTKRILDPLVAAALTVLLSPFWLWLILWILVKEGRPVFFRQTRVGLGRRRFRIFKFRTMTSSADTGDADENLPIDELRHLRAAFRTTSRGDVRITHVGRFLRRTSLDELPQLFNVLAGDMSLVGPRPITPLERSDYEPEEWRMRHTVRPGLTGLAQVSGRSALTPPEVKAFDREYVERHSLSMDLAVLMRTARVLFGDSASN
jgi:lipopolysaccharide/colanic/teichoic acid biosynthesis glycosyltransferase